MGPEPLYNEKQLLLDVANGDEAAFRNLFNGYRDRLYAYSLKITSTREMAEDIVQDTFLKIWLRRQQLREISSFNAYIFRMASNAVVSALRRRASEFAILEERLSPPEMEVQPDEELHFKLVKEVLQKAVSELPEQQKNVYILRRQDGRPPGEIASLLHISENTVKRHLTMAQKTLRKALEDYFPQDAGIILIILGMFY